MTPGTLVDGRFRLLQQVGQGGMGVVFRATDESNGQLVAIKLLEGRDLRDAERARREAQVLAKLRHPAIVAHVADGVLPDGMLYLAMEWVDGITVGHRIVREGFTLAEAIAVVRTIASALAAAHRDGVFHRDIKPSNVLLARNDPADAKLIDFGIARFSDAVQALTRTGSMIGTPAYMAPEQARGERTVTAAADVFGLGCLLYELATGKPAFSGTVSAAVLSKILFAEPRPLAQSCPEAPVGLGLLVERMLAKSASARPSDGAAVVAAIDALGPIPASPRRSAREMTATETKPFSPAISDTFDMQCLVAATRVRGDDLLEPPSEDQLRLLADHAGRLGVRLEILATGATVAHVHGNARDTAIRSARMALFMRGVLVDWAISISSVDPDATAVVETGTALLGQAELNAIFRRGPEHVLVDSDTARYLGDDFELDPGPPVQLLRER